MSSYSTLNKVNPSEIQNLVWKQPKFSADHYELCADQKIFADLTFTKMFSDRANAYGAHGSWILDRPGFFRDQVLVWVSSSTIETALAVRGWLGDYKLTLSGRGSFQFFRTKILANTWAMTSENDLLLYEIQFGFRWFKQYNPVWLRSDTITSFESHPDQLELLLVLGLYLGTCSNQDAAGAVAATSAAATC